MKLLLKFVFALFIACTPQIVRATSGGFVATDPYDGGVSVGFSVGSPSYYTYCHPRDWSCRYGYYHGPYYHGRVGYRGYHRHGRGHHHGRGHKSRRH